MDVMAWRRRLGASRARRKHNPFVDVDPRHVHKHHHDPLIGHKAVGATPKNLFAMTGFDVSKHKRLHSSLLSVQAYMQSNVEYRYHPVVLGVAGVLAGFTMLFVGSGVAYAAFNREMPTPKAVATSIAGAIPAAAHPLQKSTTTTTAPKSKKKTNGAVAPATADIPPEMMKLYRDAAASCGMQWQIVAAVGKIETNHSRSNAPGVHNGANYAGAEGPMQFMPATWMKYGVDGDHNGTADIYNNADAVFSAANYMCANGAADPSKINNALWHYNHDQGYVNTVLATAKKYLADAYVSPIPTNVDANVGKPHHDYPADDIPLPVGTPIYAARGGSVRTLSNGACGYGVILSGDDGNTYTYCHASALDVRNSTKVSTGDLIMHSGGQPGAAGAGDSTGPHLHFQVNVGGRNVCPQDLLKSWKNGEFMSPDAAKKSGCVS